MAGASGYPAGYIVELGGESYRVQHFSVRSERPSIDVTMFGSPTTYMPLPPRYAVEVLFECPNGVAGLDRAVWNEMRDIVTGMTIDCTSYGQTLARCTFCVTELSQAPVWLASMLGQSVIPTPPDTWAETVVAPKAKPQPKPWSRPKRRLTFDD